MDNVRLQFLYPADELPGGIIGSQTVLVKKTGDNPMLKDTPLVPDRHKTGFALLDAVTSVAVSDIAFPTVLHGKFANLLHDTSGGSIDP